MKETTWEIAKRTATNKPAGKTKKENGGLPKSIALMLCVGLLQVAGYYFAGAMAKIDGPGIAVPQPDTLLYCQAARRIAEGHPFSFSAGEAATTGTTSVAYPFVLAVPYLLGAKGDALLTAGFVLNALLYLVFLAGWGVAIRHWLDRPVAQMTASLLVALSGQAAFCALAQSDIGMWLAASAWLAAGLAMGNAWIYAPLLIAGPWIRPEGMVCVVAFAAIAALLAIIRRKVDKGAALVAALGILSTLGVFALNYALSGETQFSSVAQKGYLKQYDFATAIAKTAMDALKMAKAFFLGLPQDAPRDFYAIPVLGALFLWRGILNRPWRIDREPGLFVWCLAALGGFATVAQSGWQDTNMDRYLAWFLPVALVFTADGAASYGRQTRGKHLRLVPPAMTCVFAGATAIVLMAIFHSTSAASDRLYEFAKECEGTMRGTASVGCYGICGAAYSLAERRVAHIPGVYSRTFSGGRPEGKFETLKNEPDTRFEYWLLSDAEDLRELEGRKDQCLGPQLLAGPDGYELRLARWDAFKNAATPPPAPEGKRLVARVDIGYWRDEKAANYRVFDRYRRPKDFVFTEFGKLNGTDIVECGRLVVGADEMTVPLATGRETTVVMRTLPERAFSINGLELKYGFKSPLALCVEADGEEACDVFVPYAEKDFSDASFTIPGAAIQKSPCRLRFNGDHIACAYWFYQ